MFRTHAEGRGCKDTPNTDHAHANAHSADAGEIARTVTVCVLVPTYYHVRVSTQGPTEACERVLSAVKAGKFKGVHSPAHALDPVVTRVIVHTGNACTETVPERFGRGALLNAFRRAFGRVN